MGLLRDLCDVLRAGGLTVGAYLLPLGLGLVGTITTLSLGAAEEVVVDAPVDRPSVEVQLAAWSPPVPSEPPLEEAGEADAPAEEALVEVAAARPVEKRAVTRPDEGTASAPDAAAAPPPTKKKKRSCQPSGLGGITRIGQSSFVIDRGVVSYYSKHLKALDELVWVKKQDGDDGKALGYRLGGIRCGSDLHLAGLRNGDVVRSVNGHRVRSLPEALLTFSKLKKATVIEVEVQRKTGGTETLVYTLS